MDRVEVSIAFSPASGSIIPILMILYKNHWCGSVGSCPLSLSNSSWLKRALSGVQPGTHWPLEVLCWGVELEEVWEEWCTVMVTVTISMTAPINKKQKKVGIKYLAKIL